VAAAGDACHQLYFLINGSVKVETSSEDYSYTVTEHFSAPYILQQEAVFGYYQRYTHTYSTISDANFLTISKEEVLRLLEDFLVFRLNLVNFFATQSQKHTRLLWQRSPQDLRGRVIRFLTSHCLYPAGQKTFSILMEQLALELNDSRLNVSRVLNQLQRDGLVELHRGKIIVPQLERLLM
jgi:CRP-like cAMP-binding protein